MFLTDRLFRFAPMTTLLPRLALAFLLLLAASQTASAQTATSTNEDRVELAWPASWQADRTQSVYVYRTALSGAPDGTLGDLITVASAESGAWADRAGVPMQRYEYCLVRRTPDQAEQARACVEGRRVIRAPRSLTATTTRADGIALAWRNTSALEGRTLRIYRSRVFGSDTEAVISPATLLASDLPATTTAYVDTSALQTRYAYAVTTVSEGVNSDAVHAVGERVVVPAPRLVAASDGADPAAVRVSWEASETFPLSTYYVYREPLAAEGDANGALDSGTPGLTFFVVPVAPADTVAGSTFAYMDSTASPTAFYEYCVTAVAPSGFPSSFVCDAGSRTGLRPPTAVSATDETLDEGVDVSWTYSGSDADGFVVSRACVTGREGAACASGTTTAAELGRAGGAVRRFEDRTAVQGVTYRYEVVATTSKGAQSAVAAEQQDEGTRAYVLAPTTVSASDGDFEDRTEVTWETTSTTALVYTVTRGGTVIGVVSPATLTLADRDIRSDAASTYCVSTLTVPSGASAAVAARMRADVQAALARSGQPGGLTPGNSAQSARDRLAGDLARIGERAQADAPRAKADPVTSAPVCDTGFRSLRPPASVAASDDTDERVVRVTWTDASSVETGYLVYRWSPNDRGGFSATPAGRVGPNRTQFVDDGGTAGVGYTYSVATVDTLGTQQADGLGGTFAGHSLISSDGANPLPAVSDAGRRVLLPPSAVTVTDGQFEDKVIVRWEDNSALVDGAGYRVERWATSGAPADGPAPESGVQVVCDVGPRATECTDDDFSAADYGVAYTYRVHAYHREGRSLPVASGDDRARGGTVVLAPQDLSASTTYEGQVVVTWTDASAVNAGYRVTVDGAPIADASLQSGTVSSFTDAGLTSTASRRYCVRAYTGGGAASEEACATGRIWVQEQTGEQAFGLILSTPTTPTTESGNQLGYAVATSGNEAMAGAPGDPEGGNVYRFALGSSGWTSRGALPRSDERTFFGRSVAMNEDYVLVGAEGEVVVESAYRDVRYTNQHGQRFDERIQVRATYRIGGAYLYARSGNGWELVHEFTLPDGDPRVLSSSELTDCIKPINSEGNRNQGYFFLNDTPECRTMSGLEFRGTYMIGTGSGFPVYQLTTNDTWLNSDTAENPYQGTYGSGEGAGFEPNWDRFVRNNRPVDSVRRFGLKVALGGDYAYVAYGLASTQDVRTGVAVFRRDAGGTWSFEAMVLAAAGITALAAGDDWVAVGLGGLGEVRELRNGGSGWALSDTPLTPSAGGSSGPIYGYGTSLAVLGDRLAVGGLGREVHLWAYDPSSMEWVVEERFTREAPAQLGASVALSEAEGLPLLAAGDPASGGVLLYTREAGTWAPLGEMRAAEGQEREGTGTSIAFTGADLVIGAVDPASEAGAVYFGALGLRPDNVAASDGTYDNRIQIRWRDRTDLETGYRIYRSDGDAPIGTVEAGVAVFDDFDAPPGSAFSYCVAAFATYADGTTAESPRSCDIGWKPADGRISGRVASGEGAGVQDVEVCLMPSPNRAALFDGVAGAAQANQLDAMPQAFTVEMWARRSRTGVQEILFSHGQRSVDSGHLQLGFRSNGNVLFAFWADDLEVDGGVDARDWNHYAFTYDGATRSVYVNGELKGQDMPDPYVGRGVVRLGAGQDGFDHFSGLLDEVRLWSGARTSEQIVAAMRQRQSGEESALVAYWPLDQSTGAVAPDVSARAAHLALEGGAHWGGGAPGVGSCQTTSADGTYTHRGIRYGEGETFAVRPSADGRTFLPGEQAINLTPESPVENQVDFTDTSAFTVAGTVSLGAGAGACAADSVRLFVDGVFQTTTKRDGSYVLSVQPTVANDPENRLRRITAQRTQGEGGTNLFAFAPALHEFAAERDTSGVDFAVTTERTLSGFVGGGCGVSLGTVTLRVYTEDGCFDRTIQVQNSYAEQLPPQQYLVDVVSVDLPEGSPLSQSDVLAFYDGLGTQRLDLTASDQRLDLIYRAPVEVAISGLPEARAQCSATGLLADGAQIPNVPILPEYARIPLSITVQERYGPGATDVCPIDSARVQIFDGFADRQDEPTTLATRATGEANYVTFARSPEIASGARVGGVDRSYQKSLSAVAEVPGRGTVTETVWAVVEGYRERTAEFVSVTTADMPLLVLHDPPGSESYAYIEEGVKSCTRMSSFTVQNFAAGTVLDVALGFKAALGFGVTIENGAGLLLQTNTVAGQKNQRLTGDANSNIEICATTTERITTAGDRTWVGEDIMMGTALNLKFALADDLRVNECVIDFSEKLAADLDETQPFATTYVYGTTHIRHSLIPSLEKLVAQDDATLEGDEDGDGTLEQIKLSDALAGWRGFLTQNEANIEAAFKGMRKSENRSFSGGTQYEWSHTADTTRTLRATSTTAYVTSENVIGAVITGFGYDSKFGVAFNLSQEWTTETGASVDTTRTVGYVLADGDTGDSFTLDVGTDPVYGTPAFRTVSGRSSWPWESGTQRRDWVTASVTPPVQRGVAADGTAVFTLGLTNRSESKETREYVLAVSPENNPHSAVIGLTGDPLVEKTFVLQPDETVSVTLGVERGPGDVYDYDDLVLLAYPAVEYAIWQSDPRQTSAMIDTARFSVSFTPPCSPLELQRPEAGWRLNADAEGSTVELVARGFAIPQTADDKIGFEYRRDGGPWTLASSPATGTTLAGATDVSVDWTPPGEGAYEVRAFAQCKLDDGAQARTDTPSAEGVVDTSLPQLVGTPSPQDGALDLGDDVTLRLSEALDCTTAVTTAIGGYRALGIRDAAGNAVLVDPVCEGRTVALVPRSEAFWGAREGEVFTAFVSPPVRSTAPGDGDRVTAGLTDAAGNPLAGADGAEITEAITWSFAVRRSLLRFAPPNLALDLSRGTGSALTATLVNDDAQERTVRLSGGAPWMPLRAGAGLTLAADTTATLPAGGALTLRFDLADSLALGARSAEVWAQMLGAGGAPVAGQRARFRLDALVGCTAPEWALDASRFEYAMQMVADVFVPASGDPSASGVPLAGFAGLGDGMIAAFVGAELRGLAALDPARANSRIPLAIYSSRARGEGVRFEVWDAANCTRYPAAAPGLAFEQGKQVGTPSVPAAVYGVPVQEADGSVPLFAGWTWFSLPFQPASAAPSAVLAGVPASHGDRLQGADADGQSVFAVYDAPLGAWLGSLTEIVPGRGYQIYLSRRAALVPPLGAPLADPSQAIPLRVGWNRIGYLPGCPLALGEALVGLSPAPADGDVVQGQRGFAVYDAAQGGWSGSLLTLEPGAGYLMQSASGGTLRYPTTAQPDGSGACAPVAPLAPPRAASLWRADPQPHASAMTLVVAVPGLPADSTAPSYEVVAFDGAGEPASADVRGLAPLTYDAARGHHVAFLTVYGGESAGETIRLHLGASGAAQALRASGGAALPADALAEPIAFQPSRLVGTPSDPVRFDGVALAQPIAAANEGASELPTQVELGGAAPNPFTDRALVHYALPEAADVRLTVYDVLGRRVLSLVEAKRPAGRHTTALEGSGLASGLYFLRLDVRGPSGSKSEVSRVTLVR